jgi:hypothetical protein
MSNENQNTPLAADTPRADPYAHNKFTPQQLAEARASFPDKEAFDAALKADGFDPASLPNVALSDHPWINRDATPDAGQYARGLDLHRFATSLGNDPNTAATSLDRVANVQSGLSELAAELRLDPVLGKAFIEQMAEGSIAFKAHTPEQREQWLTEQKRSAMKVGRFADDAAYEKAVAEAREFVSAGKSELGKAIAQSDRIHDAWVLLTLLNHKGALAAHGAKP